MRSYLLTHLLVLNKKAVWNLLPITFVFEFVFIFMLLVHTLHFIGLACVGFTKPTLKLQTHCLFLRALICFYAIELRNMKRARDFPAFPPPLHTTHSLLVFLMKEEETVQSLPGCIFHSACQMFNNSTIPNTRKSGSIKDFELKLQAPSQSEWKRNFCPFLWRIYLQD